MAAVFALLFLAFAAVLMASVYWIVSNAQGGAIRDAVESDIATIVNGYRVEGIPEAIEVIGQRLGPPPRQGAVAPEEFIVLVDPQGRQLAGNLAPWPRQLGFQYLPPAPRAGARPTQATVAGATAIAHARLLGKGVLLPDGSYLFVGRDVRTMAAVQARLLQAFAWITVAALAMALLGGVHSSLRSMRRIDAIATTCNAIIEGRYSERIALTGSGDELDRLGVAINRMLDRIAMLMDNLRQVSSDIAHELRTPLSRLRQRLERAQHSRTTDEYAADVGRAMAEADHLLAMFAALLRIAEIESGARAHAFTDFSLTDQLRELLTMYAPVAEDQGHRLSADIQPDVRIGGDRELLTQLFVNLLENALRHTPRGTPIHVQLDRPGERVRVSVSDRGPGIPGPERERVLRRFYRLSASRSTPGTGLGLALVNAIAQLHGADLHLLDNEPGLRVELLLRPA